jgi:hypothetical protein
VAPRSSPTPATPARRKTASPPAGAPARRAPATPGARHAAEDAVNAGGYEVRLPVIGRVTLAPPDHLAWYAGVAVLATLELVEWPIALMLAAGKALADNHTNQSLRAFGEALEEA